MESSINIKFCYTPLPLCIMYVLEGQRMRYLLELLDLQLAEKLHSLDKRNATRQKKAHTWTLCGSVQHKHTRISYIGKLLSKNGKFPNFQFSIREDTSCFPRLSGQWEVKDILNVDQNENKLHKVWMCVCVCVRACVCFCVKERMHVSSTFFLCKHICRLMSFWLMSRNSPFFFFAFFLQLQQKNSYLPPP